MRTDGSETTKLNDEWASYMIVVGDWIYFCNKDDEGAIYKMRTDGSEKTKLNDASHCECLNILNGWIYYRNNNDGGLYKMRTDGSEQTMLNDSTSLCIHGCTTLTGMAQMG
jgi:glutamate 5-kinase